MGSEFKFGLMEPNMKEIGRMIRQRGKVSFSILMEMFLRQIFKMKKQMVKENTRM